MLSVEFEGLKDRLNYLDWPSVVGCWMSHKLWLFSERTLSQPWEGIRNAVRIFLRLRSSVHVPESIGQDPFWCTGVQLRLQQITQTQHDFFGVCRRRASFSPLTKCHFYPFKRPPCLPIRGTIMHLFDRIWLCVCLPECSDLYQVEEECRPVRTCLGCQCTLYALQNRDHIALDQVTHPPTSVLAH